MDGSKVKESDSEDLSHGEILEIIANKWLSKYYGNPDNSKLYWARFSSEEKAEMDREYQKLSNSSNTFWGNYTDFYFREFKEKKYRRRHHIVGYSELKEKVERVEDFHKKMLAAAGFLLFSVGTVFLSVRPDYTPTPEFIREHQHESPYPVSYDVIPLAPYFAAFVGFAAGLIGYQLGGITKKLSPSLLITKRKVKKQEDVEKIQKK